MVNERIASEFALADRANVTSTSLVLARREIPFPEQLEGKRILEICAGTSSTAKELRQHGATAVAVDYNYGDLKSLQQKSLKDLSEYERDQGMRRLAKLQRAIIKASGKNPFGRLDTVKGMFKERKRASQSFFKDVREHEGIYVAAIAGNLPFQSSIFDFCYSLEGITAFPIQNRETFLNSVDEGLRVLKPGGQLALAFWFPEEWDSRLTYQAHGILLLSHLAKSGIPFKEIDDSSRKALVITKP